MTLEELLRTLFVAQIEEIERRSNDPMIGAFKTGRTDVSERDEEIMYGDKSDQGG